LPEEQKGGLWGVYHFKRGFGGDLVYYVGAYDFVYSRSRYRLMNTAMTRLGSLEKLVQLGDRLRVGPDRTADE
jgi:lipid II:glycine glycyltransferase (peptidoglycan interpeptide bridge formation enzyme)